MINRVFFILNQEFVHRNLPLPDDNGYYSFLVDPSVTSSLEHAYALISNTHLPGLALMLNIQAPLTAESVRFLSSFLFLPAYLRIADRPVILLAGDSAWVIRDAVAALSSYLSEQGFGELLVHTLSPASNSSVPAGYARSVEELDLNYNRYLQQDPGYGNTLFFHPSSEELLQTAFASLRQAEMAFQQRSPRLYSLILAQSSLEKKLQSLQRKYTAVEVELQHQQQYVEILRSHHAAKEIQDYYSREYEILPLWYKRFGQLLKVLTGKRTFKSLFRDDIKKYKV